MCLQLCKLINLITFECCIKFYLHLQGKDESGPTGLLTGHASRYGFADQHSGVFTKLQVRHNLAIMA